MNQQELHENAWKKQEEYIHEMENYIFFLETQNKLQKQLIENLQEENSVMQQQYEKYTNLVNRMMEDLQ